MVFVRKTKDEAESSAATVADDDSPRDRAFSSWLADVEDYLKRTFGRRADHAHKDLIGALIGHDPALGWGSDINDGYHLGGMKFDNDGKFVELGPYWTRVRAVGRVLARQGHHRAMGTLRDTVALQITAADKDTFDRMRQSVKAHQPPASAPPSHDLPRTHPGSHGDAWEAPTGKDAACGRDEGPVPVDTTDYSETAP